LLLAIPPDGEPQRGEGSTADYDTDAWAAFAAALFFAVHPLRVESVAWVTERRDVLAGLFYVLAVGSYLRIGESGDASADARHRLRCFVWFLLSLLAKAWAITLPVVLLVLDVYPLARRENRGRLLAEKAPFFAASLLFAWLAASAQASTHATRTLADFGIVDRALQASYGLWFYASRTLAPAGLRPLVMLEDHMDAGAYVASAAAVAVITLALVALRRRCRACWLRGSSTRSRSRRCSACCRADRRKSPIAIRTSPVCRSRCCSAQGSLSRCAASAALRQWPAPLRS
jgi:hypothetical protein